MNSTGNGTGHFQVLCSKAVARSLRALQRRASQQGRGKAVLAAFRRVVGMLRRNPTSVGEPLFHLPALRMQIRCVVIGPLVLDFAIHEDRPVVFIKGAKLLSQ